MLILRPLSGFSKTTAFQDVHESLFFVPPEFDFGRKLGFS